MCVCVWGGGVLCLVLVLLFSTLCPSSFCNHLDGEDRAGYVTLIVFLMSCDLIGILGPFHMVLWVGP